MSRQNILNKVGVMEKLTKLRSLPSLQNVIQGYYWSQNELKAGKGPNYNPTISEVAQGLYGQGKSGKNVFFSRWSGKVRESQGKSGNSTKKSGKSWKKSGRFFWKVLISSMNQDPLFFKIQSIFFKIQLRQVTCEIFISAAELMFLCMYALGVHSSFCCWLILYCSFIF